MTELQLWSWGFLVVYVAAMVGFGIAGMRRVRGGDDFATARSAYGPLFLALAFAATTASGATFLGLPGFAYTNGVSAFQHTFFYPAGVYLGVLICLRAVSRAGASFGNRTIPEFLGDRYQSELLRVCFALFSLMLLFYLAGQLVAGLVMFEQLLGLSPGWALGITAAVLGAYVVIGGAHADILTDGTQGGLMVMLSLAVVAMFVVGFGVGEGAGAVFDRLEELDAGNLAFIHPTAPIFDSWWDVVAVFLCHVPLGLLPHIGNKLWALRAGTDRRVFIVACFALGFALPLMTFGGLLARAVLGDALLVSGGGNAAVPALFIELLPVWLAALLGVGILSAVMSTADGLVVSTSQVFANDLYRCSIAPRWHADKSEAEIDVIVLRISRIATALTLAAASAMAWALLDMNVALLVWIGVGGMMAALAGPLVLGVLWQGVTRAGALAGFAAGAGTFIVAKAALIPAAWFAGTPLAEAAVWFEAQAVSPYACATLGEFASVAATVLVSRFTEPPSRAHLERIFGPR
ncbi:MAG: sodium:solute symporter family protein [Myxococcota bacterium]